MFRRFSKEVELPSEARGGAPAIIARALHRSASSHYQISEFAGVAVSQPSRASERASVASEIEQTTEPAMDGVPPAAAESRPSRGAPPAGAADLLAAYAALRSRASALFDGLRDVPQYGQGLWENYFRRTFDAYNSLWKFQQEHRSTLEGHGVLRRHQIGEVAVSAQLSHLLVPMGSIPAPVP